MLPNCITEKVDENGKIKKAINFELLKQMLLPDVVEGDERYEFTWVGKKAAIVEDNKPIRKTLRPVLNGKTVPTGADSEGKHTAVVEARTGILPKIFILRATIWKFSNSCRRVILAK